MAKTRAQIKTAVDANTGRATEKNALIESLCDEALKLAINKHPFRDAQSEPIAFDITEDAVSVDISSITDLVHIVTARITEGNSSTTYANLVLRDRTWWDRHVINPEDNQKGWPVYGLRWKGTIRFDRPANSNLELRLVTTQEQAFASDATECPVKILDLFVIQYVTAFVFLSIQNMESYAYWKNIALGFKWDNGTVGGTLRHAIITDKYDLSEEMRASGGDSGSGRPRGLSILNQLINYDRQGNSTPHDLFGSVVTWY